MPAPATPWGMQLLTRLVSGYRNLGVRPGDDRELVLKKRLYVPMASSGVFVAGVLALLEYLLVDSPAWINPAILCGVFVASLLILHFSGKLVLPIYLGFLGLLLGPPINQWSLGGLEAAGALMLWGISAPFGALLFQGIREALPQFVLYSLVGLGVVFAERLYPAPWPAMPAHLSMWVYAFNFGGFVMFIYLNVRHFVVERNDAMQALDREHALLKAEQARSERLLLNVLPAPIAARLKQNEKYIADGYPEVTVLFADIVGFTPLSARIAPDRLVRLLNELFSLFDALAEKHGLEKIKTIGDAYMAAAGLPEPRDDHAEACARMALDMVSTTEAFSQGDIAGLRLRVGLHTGPVTAGVIGSRKFIYDLWGDTVNTASRMESHSEPGRIQISAALRHSLGAAAVVEDRGEILIKGKGPMQAFYLDGLR